MSMWVRFILIIHLGKYIANNAPIIVLCHMQELWPRQYVVQVVLHLVIFWQAEKVAALHLKQVIHGCRPYAHHLGSCFSPNFWYPRSMNEVLQFFISFRRTNVICAFAGLDCGDGFVAKFKAECRLERSKFRYRLSQEGTQAPGFITLFSEASSLEQRLDTGMAENLEAQAAAVALDERHEDAPKCHLMDACDSLLLQAILLQLDSAADLAHVQCTCKALHRAAQDPALWGALCEKDFGLKLQGEQTRASYCMMRGGLASSGGTSIVLPFHGAVTDTGVDAPISDHWAHNLFSVTPRSIFSTAASVSNAHVFGVLSPWTDQEAATSAGSSSSQALSAGSAQSIAHSENEPLGIKQVLRRLEEGNVHRPFLVRRLQHVAEMFVPGTQGQGSSAAPAANIKALAAQARAALEGCSTTGLEDMLLLAYSALVRREPMGQALLQGITSPMQLAGLRDMAVEIWNAETPHLKQEILGFEGPPAPPTGGRKDAAGGPLYEKHAMLVALAHASASHSQAGTGAPCAQTEQSCCSEGPNTMQQRSPVSLGMVEEVLVSSHQHVTCPIKCGVLYTCVVPPALTHSGQSSRIGHGTLPGHTSQSVSNSYSGSRSPTGGSTSRTSSNEQSRGLSCGHLEEAARGLLVLPNHPMVQVCNDMTEAQQVLEASAKGLLPPVYNWFQCPEGEWVEFDLVPSVSTTGVRSTDESVKRDQEVVDSSQLTPVVWFRLYQGDEKESWIERNRDELAKELALESEQAPAPAHSDQQAPSSSSRLHGRPGAARRSMAPCPALDWNRSIVVFVKVERLLDGHKPS
uniref:F-box domain-containing protein n=1 Tax=Dunaliella tertiolecta TaxID=3047 RepID=A0A7S3VPW9_DUNTE